MIGTIEDKLCTAGYRTEFADNKPVIIYRIMVEDIVLLEVSRIIHKIIVDSEVAYLDCRAREYCPSICLA